MAKIVYFARVRDAVGIAEEEFVIPVTVTTVRQLAHVLSQQSAGHAEGLGDVARLRAAVDLVMAQMDDGVQGAREIAFFPPVTGG